MKKGFLGIYIIGSALIWALVIVVISFGLVNVVQKTNVIIISGLGALLHIILVWGMLSIRVKKDASK